MGRCIFVFFILSINVFLFQGCSTETSDEVVIYTSVDQVFAEPILKDLQKETGIKVNTRFLNR